MSREIKFRAWDEKNKRMLYTIPWLICDKKTGVYTVGSLDPPNPFDIDPHADQKYQIHGYLDGGIYAYPAILMQFTCLTDNKGKEIYEGDIVNNGIVTNDIMCVLWNNKLAQFAFYASTEETSYIEPLSIFETKQYEVIGNIYESPELLKKTQ